MKRYILGIWVLTSLLAVSCMEEMGNYDYTDINEIQIDSIKGYKVTQFDTLRIFPAITQSLGTNEENLEFLWYWYKAGDEKRVIDTLGHTRDLTYYIAAEPGLYETRLKVTDKNTGLFSRKVFQVSVEADNSGILILSEINEKANLSILNFAGLYFQDVYYSANGEYAGRHPVAIADIDHEAKHIHEILIMCKDETGGVLVDPSTFRKVNTYSDLFYTLPNPLDPDAYQTVNNEFTSGMSIDYDFIINNGRLYNRDYLNAPTGALLLYKPEILGNYKLAPYAFLGKNSLLFYDNKNYCFRILQCARGLISTNKFSPAPLVEGTDVSKLAFDPQNVQLELVYGGEGWKKDADNMGAGYGIFRRPGSKLLSDMFCLKFYIGTSMSYAPPYGEYFTPYFKRPVQEAPGMENASAYALSKKDPYLYYAHQNKIYSYDLEYDKAKVIYDVDTTVVGKGATVDYLYFRPGINTDYSLKMWAATSGNGKSGKSGSVHVLELGRNGDVIKVDTVYQHVCGKVVGMAYKRR